MSFKIKFPPQNGLLIALTFLMLSSTVNADVSSFKNWKYRWWEHIRAERQADHDQHLVNQKENFDKYRSMPTGTIGVPAVIFRLFPYVLPEIWGTPESNFSVLGLIPDKYDSDAVFPIGLGHIEGAISVPTPQGDFHMRVVSNTCAACHTGRVELEDGSTNILIGAPATEYKATMFRGMQYATVNSEKYTAQNFIDALDQLPVGWLYGDPDLIEQEVMERAIFTSGAQQMMDSVKASINAGSQHVAATLGAYTYSGPNAPDLSQPKPGRMDAGGGYASMTVDPAQMSPEFLQAVLPPKPAISDLMYVWKMGERPNSKWGGEIGDHTHSLAGAAMGIIGSPNFVEMESINSSVEFVWDLPPTPYPFVVKRNRAKFGKRLFKRHCASCHEDRLDERMTPEEVGTDPNRSMIFSDHAIDTLRGLLRIACSDPVTCSDDSGNPIPDDVLITNSKAYAVLPLYGIWARAPYLHNGSVPTLRALLTGNRPETFYRGNITYDQKNVGFTWDEANSVHAVLYDTTIDGNSNVGHDSAEFTGGVDWSRSPVRLEALLEYLKTL
ncbi:MAG: hypothetical protein COA99_16080 [Moraxellaceae bacterium]|nr:MAG: hypothetical protein COA99_16080 [Moraxellaceae bacterium]